jgi:hypothetical protein
MLTFRDTIRQISPPWLRRGNAEKLLYALALPFDALAEAVASAVKLRFPGVYSPESLPYLGRDRRIRRGRNENSHVYAERLTRWLDDHRSRGGPYAMLAQLHAHYAPEAFDIELVYFSGRTFSLDPDGNVTISDIEWLPDADEAKWARWWLFFHWPDPIGLDGTWGDGALWGDGGVWGYDLSSEDVDDLRSVPREWNAAHAVGRLVLLFEGVELWGYPEGTWGEPGGVWGSPVLLNIGG